MPSDFYDVIVIGAGPAGSYAACKLAPLGYRVAVLEQKEAPGIGICCTGIVSPECFDSFGIAQNVILTKANSAKFFAPSGNWVRLGTEKVQAYVVDRASFDLAIAAKAKAQGVDYFFSSRVVDINIRKDEARVETLCRNSKEIFQARAVILATGFKPRLSQRLGLGRISNFAIGAQAEVETRGIDEVEIYFGQQIAPGFFAWLVPVSESKALAGVISPSHAKLYLKGLLTSLASQGKLVGKEVEIRQKAIPQGTLPRTYEDRVLVIGDAAGQVKPTTHGGIYFGHLGAKIAAEVLSEALASDDLTAARLRRYHKQWKAKMGKEISTSYRARQLYAKLSDRQIEQIFHVIASTSIAESWLESPNFSFDWHSKLILAALRRGLAHRLSRLLHVP